MDTFKVNINTLAEYDNIFSEILLCAADLADRLENILDSETINSLPMFDNQMLRKLSREHNENLCRLERLRRILEETAVTYHEMERRNELLVDSLPAGLSDKCNNSAYTGTTEGGFIPDIELKRETAAFDLFNGNLVYTEDWLSSRIDETAIQDENEIEAPDNETNI